MKWVLGNLILQKLILPVKCNITTWGFNTIYVLPVKGDKTI